MTNHCKPGQRENPVYCPYCGSLLVKRMLEGRSRLFCESCDEVFYQNPLPSVAILAVNDHGKLLLVRRSVEPGRGDWCLPGGFIEVGERAEEAVLRELEEETGLSGEITGLVDVCTQLGGYYGDVILIGYRVKITRGNPRPGDDAGEVGYFDPASLPPLAFRCHERLVKRFLGG